MLKTVKGELINSWAHISGRLAPKNKHSPPVTIFLEYPKNVLREIEKLVMLCFIMENCSIERTL